jgi:transcription initiation factor IIE alpha subunit
MTPENEFSLKDQVLAVLETKCYKDDWGFGLTSLEIANELNVQRDLITPIMTQLGRSGATEYVQCKRGGSSDARLWWLTGKSPIKIKIDHTKPLKDRARELCKYIRIITNKHNVDDPMQDLMDIEDKARTLFPELY